MIPRLKPYFDFKEIEAILRSEENSVEKFEKEFARTFGAKYALSFPYGRSAIYALFKCLGIEDSEIIVPAYTCVVVPHAVVLSGNIPRFVDTAPNNFNLDLEGAKKKINERTKAIIPGNIFGYPVDIEELKEIKNIKKDILIIQDCAHCVGSRWKGKLVCNEGDVALFSLNISKYISSIFGGILTMNNEEIYKRLKDYRNKNFKKSAILRAIKSFIYFLATYPAFNKFFFNFFHYFDYLEGKKILGKLTQYYKEEKIDLPGDAFELMTPLEARVGLEQLKKYPEIFKKRKFIAEYYNDNLKDIPGLVLPPIVEGATYSHYVPRIKNRERVIKKMREKGVQLGKLINYSIPHMKVYQRYKDSGFENSLKLTQEVINLPIYPDITLKDLDYIIQSLKGL